ncbi:MAG: SIR2 family protein [Dehalococcoidia bacterium]|nr:SIR2 family protein [Dehalococcoidia bacterium]
MLFLGAGASRASLDANGNGAPTGVELAAEIADAFLGEYDGWPLAMTTSFAEAVVGRSEVEGFIRRRLDGLAPSKGLVAMTRLPWRCIYTTNFDLLVEEAYKDEGAYQKVRPIYSSKTLLRDLGPKEIPLYKLHGCISRIDTSEGRLVLTGEDFARAQELRRRLFQRLADDASENTILYVGYGREDPDFQKLIGEVAEQMGGLDRLPRSYAVSPGYREFEKLHWEARKITLINQDGESNLIWLENECRSVGIGQPTAVRVPKIFEPSAQVSDATSEGIRRHFDVVVEELERGAPDFSAFYRGDRPTWGQIQGGCDANRDIEDEIVLELLAHAESRGPRLALIRAEAGAGKTTLLRRLAADMAAVWELPVLSLKEKANLEHGLLHSVARLLDRRLYVIVDDADDHAREISQFVTQGMKAATDVTLVAASRANEWADRTANLQLPPIATFDLAYLTENEIGHVLKKLEEFGELGALEALSPERRREEFRRRAERQLLVAMREATSGETFDAIIRDEYDSIPSEEAKQAYLCICALYQARVPLRAGLLRRLTGIPFEEFAERILKPAERVIVEESDDDGDSYRARHPIIAQIVVDYVLPSAVDRLALYRTILESIDLGYEEDLLAYRRISRARELVDLLGSYDLKSDFYKACRELDETDGIVAQHWAILAMDNQRFGLAESLLGEARQLLPKDPSIQHSVGMLSFRRYQASKGGGAWDRIHFDRAEEAFRKLIRRLPGQAAAYDSLARLYQECAQRAETAEQRVGWYSRAHDVLMDGIRNARDRSSLYACSAQLLAKVGEYEDAEQSFRSSLNSRPDNTAARHLFARFLIDRDRSAEAIEVLENGIQYDGDDRRLRHSLAVALALAGKPREEVVAQFRLAVHTVPRHWSAAFDLAVYLYLVGAEAEAREIFDDLRDVELDRWETMRVRVAFTKEAPAREGRIVTLHESYGFIQVDGHALDVYLDCYRLDPDVSAQLAVGRRVRFAVGFNLLGPVARGVSVVG